MMIAPARGYRNWHLEADGGLTSLHPGQEWTERVCERCADTTRSMTLRSRNATAASIWATGRMRAGRRCAVS